MFDEIEAQKKTTTGQKVDIAFSKLRIAFAADDLKLMSKTIEKAKEYVETGGDWERRNRLKVYEAVFFTRTRHFSEAANMYATTPFQPGKNVTLCACSSRVWPRLPPLSYSTTPALSSQPLLPTTRSLVNRSAYSFSKS